MYGDANTIIKITNAQPELFNLENEVDPDASLVAIIESFLTDITDMINIRKNRDYEAEGYIPPMVNRIADRICANYIFYVKDSQDGNIVDTEEGIRERVSHADFSDDILRDLRVLPGKPRISVRLTTAST